MAGRKPKPTALKKLAGNPGKRPLNESEPEFEARMMSVPRHLDDEARREWRRVVRELFEVGLITKVDRAALAAYCQAWSRWVEAENDLQDQKLVLTSANGYRYPNPLIGIANTAMKDMKSFMAEFGMTPSSRSRVKVEKPEGPDELEQLLFRNKRVKIKKDGQVR
ncbi:MAG: phage terminase small subunit P27 family [Anaerolineaceae bacterium]|nr:phage terminase small subunit P27 family [Anaerolineaceae bacterium]